jgi:hypothetical protein
MKVDRIFRVRCVIAATRCVWDWLAWRLKSGSFASGDGLQLPQEPGADVKLRLLHVRDTYLLHHVLAAVRITTFVSLKPGWNSWVLAYHQCIMHRASAALFTGCGTALSESMWCNSHLAQDSVRSLEVYLV